MIFWMIVGVIITFQCIGLTSQDSTEAQSSQASERQRAPRKKIIGFNVLKGVTTLEFAPPGVLFHRTIVLGNHTVTDEGFYFTPLTKAPDRLPEENFKRHFWYNSLVKELFVPYSEMRSVKTWGGIIIKTTAGMRFKVHMKNYRQVADEIKRKMNAQR